MDGWSSSISGDERQGYEVNQAKGLAVANGAYVSVSVQEPVRAYVPCFLPELIGYSNDFIFKRELVMGNKHHFHVYNSEKCDCDDLYLNRQFSWFTSVECCPGELDPAMKFLHDAGQVI